MYCFIIRCVCIIFQILVKYQIELLRFISFTLIKLVDLCRYSMPRCQLHPFLMHRPKEDLSLLLQYILKSLNDGQYNDGRQINYQDITVIHYKYGTITVWHRISHKRDRIKRFGPTNKSSVSGGRGTNLSQWVFLQAKYTLWVNEFASRLNLLTSATLIFSYVTCLLINLSLLECNCKRHKEQTKNLRSELFNKIVVILQTTYTIESRVNHLLY